jgi:hypothetical protein
LGSTGNKSCICPAGSYGSPATGCRTCPHISTSPLGSLDISNCVCPKGFGVARLGYSRYISSVDDVCDAEVGQWILGQTGQSCTDTCAGRGRACQKIDSATFTTPIMQLLTQPRNFDLTCTQIIQEGSDNGRPYPSIEVASSNCFFLAISGGNPETCTRSNTGSRCLFCMYVCMYVCISKFNIAMLSFVKSCYQICLFVFCMKQLGSQSTLNFQHTYINLYVYADRTRSHAMFLSFNTDLHACIYICICIYSSFSLKTCCMLDALQLCRSVLPNLVIAGLSASARALQTFTALEGLIAPLAPPTPVRLLAADTPQIVSASETSSQSTLLACPATTTIRCL